MPSGTARPRSDALNRAVAQAGALGSRTSTGYDVVSRAAARLSAVGRTTTTAFDALGRTVASTDALGNTSTTVYDAAGNAAVHALSCDVLGRVVSDAVTMLGGGVDGSVRRVETAYDSQDHAYLLTTYDAATGGSIVMQVQKQFDGLGNLTREWQSHSGAVNTSTTPSVQYAYSTLDSTNRVRLTSMTYPSGYVLTYNYSSGLNGDISRLSSLSDAGGSLEGYDYLGLGTVVRRSHSGPGVDLTYIGSGTADAGDQYVGLDRFGRVVNQKWVKSGTSTDEFNYTYDRDSNRLTKGNAVNTSFNETYTYDGLNQLTGFNRGSGTRTQAFDYDALGNRDSVTTNGGTAQTYTANKQNEITSVSGATTPTYDANGNTTTDETGRQFVYDAWNKLKVVKNSGGTTLKTYGYDATGRRITETASGTTTDLYYSAQWQVLEEAVSGATKIRNVWSPVYVDARVLRDRDADANTANGLEERLYVQQDANFNVTAIVDGSGAVAERYAYDPYGVATVMDASWTGIGSSAYSWVYLHQGGRLDATSGLYHFRNRDYSPTMGRWISMDPMGYGAGDANLYGYAYNNPQCYTDFSGLAVCFKSITVTDGGESIVWGGRAAEREFKKLGLKTDPVGNLSYGFQVEVKADVSNGDKITNGDIEQKVARVTHIRKNEKSPGDWYGGGGFAQKVADKKLISGDVFKDIDSRNPKLYAPYLKTDGSFHPRDGGLFGPKSGPNYMVKQTDDTLTWVDFPGFNVVFGPASKLPPEEWWGVYFSALFQITAKDKEGDGETMTAEFMLHYMAGSDGKKWVVADPEKIASPKLPKTWTKPKK